MTPIPANDAPFLAMEIVRVTKGHWSHTVDKGRSVRGISTDSRSVRPGEVFVAISGDRFDGHAFLDAAVERGATVLVVQSGRAAPRAFAEVIEVSDPLVALGDLAREHLRKWKAETGGRTLLITGSAGKTTTRVLAHALLAQRGSVLATQGNLNNRIGLPMMALLLNERHSYAVLEAGMSVRGEIEELSRIAEPDVGLITNCALAHAEGVGGTRKDVAHEKGALFQALNSSGVAIANKDDSECMRQLIRAQCASNVTFGRASDSNYRLSGRANRGTLSAIEVERSWEEARDKLSFDLSLLGEAAALDAVAALAAADALLRSPLSVSEVHAAMATVKPMEGRARIETLADGTLLIDDAYNANPLSMAAAIQLLGEVASGARPDGARTGVVVGDMKELGPASLIEHQKLGERLRDAKVDWIVACGELCKITAAVLPPSSVRWVATASEACDAAMERSRPGDAILVKGSNSLGLSKVVEAFRVDRGVRR